MKRYNIHALISVLTLLVGVGLTGCVQEMDNITFESDHISFSPYMAVETKSSSCNISTSGILDIESVDWMVEGPQTKVSPTLLLEGDANVTAYLYEGEWNDTKTSWSSMTNAKFIFDGNLMTGENKVMWGTVSGQNMRVYAYAPYINSQNLAQQVTGAPKLSFTPETDVTEQVDLIGASAVVSVAESKGKSIALGFRHALTGIKFRAGFACTVKSVMISGVYGSGVYSIGEGWTIATDAKQTYKIDFPSGNGVSKNSMITDEDQTLMLVPQTLPAGAEVSLVYSAGGTEKTIRASLEGLVWEPGKMITYTLYEEVSESNYVYFDLAAGNVSIGTTYSGTIYVNGVATTVSGSHDSKNVYYVYQSSTTTDDYDKSHTGYKTVADFENKVKPTIPDYDPVTRNGQLWSEFITNNNDVNSVITAWYVGMDKTSKDKRADLKGRTATGNRITVTAAANSSFNLVIDDIYSTYQTPSSSRKDGGITYSPAKTQNCVLTVNLIGDNRVGNIYYYNHPNNFVSSATINSYSRQDYITKNTSNGSKIVFEGTGSLTVADVIEKKGKASGLPASEPEGFFGNYYCAAIGGNDDGTAEQSSGIEFNSGIVFAGTTVAENCSAIGGGGNGFGEVTINGGIVTAVAATTGTALGGGIGYSSHGGEGRVNITGGTVYAYNLDNKRGIPSSAIGGAGSSESVGTWGTVNITGGYVYAYSALGTAIGGGSSRKKTGGNAVVTITGGEVIAISNSGAGIGGGTACTGGETSGLNGGTASIIISGNPIIRTGSVGGGGSKSPGGKIGSADISISGGDIQAQFVMAAGAKSTPSFTMTGGTIRDSDATDNSEYIHLQKNGGAVYLEDGTFNMSGGTIRDCAGEYGGAVYIKKGAESNEAPSFNMSGGEIYLCKAEMDGGAVYLEDGFVTISGNNTKIRACESNYSGGAICIRKTGDIDPAFSMSGGTLCENYAVTEGGAVHLEGGQVTVSGGNINGNVVLNGNGGGISINSGSFEMPSGGNAIISANSALRSNAANTDDAGNGGGVYVTSQSGEVSVNLFSGSIFGNSSAMTGGGIGVDVSKVGTSAKVIVGESGEGPVVTGNVTLLQGGGLYVNGEAASIEINAGTIKENTTVGYVDNPDVMNADGMVTLNGGDVRSVNVVYEGNGGYLKGDADIKTSQQSVVTDTNNKLIVPTFVRNGYRLVRWNTRADGLSSKDYHDGDIVKISSDLRLYAIWELD